MRLAFGFVLGLSSLGAFAQVSPSEENPMVGMYRHGSVDSVEQVVILPDQTFCLAVTAGSMDLLVAGRWKQINGGILMDEAKKTTSGVDVFWRSKPKKSGSAARLLFHFNGQALGDASSFLFGTSAGDEISTGMRPLFSDVANEFAEVYTETRAVTGVKSFFIAYSLHPELKREDAPIYEVLQYRLPEGTQDADLEFAITYNKQASTPPVHLQAELKGRTLVINGQSFGEREELPDSMKVGQPACVKRMAQAAEVTSEQPRDDGSVRLVAAKSFEKNLLADTKGKPLFKTPYDDPKHR